MGIHFTNYRPSPLSEHSKDDVVNRVLDFCEVSVEKQDEKRKLYSEFEDFVQSGGSFHQDHLGPLDYSMTVDKVERVLQKTFQHMMSMGQCITESQYNDIKAEKDFEYSAPPSIDVCFQSNYINKEHAEGSCEYIMPNYYLIIPDKLDTLKVTVEFSDKVVPVISKIEGIKTAQEIVEWTNIPGQTFEASTKKYFSVEPRFSKANGQFYVQPTFWRSRTDNLSKILEGVKNPVASRKKMEEFHSFLRSRFLALSNLTWEDLELNQNTMSFEIPISQIRPSWSKVKSARN